MSKGEHLPLTDEERARIVADYAAGLGGINALRTKYHRGQAHIVAVLEAAGVARRKHPTAGASKRGKPRRELVERAPGLGRQPTAREWRYIAAIFDGEGYLGHVSRGTYYRLAIVQKDERLPLRLRAMLGAGRIAGPREMSGAHHDVGAFLLEAQRPIYEFCCGVLPYVIVKRERVLQVLEDYRERYGWERTAAGPTTGAADGPIPSPRSAEAAGNDL